MKTKIARLENRARRLWSAKTLSPDSPQNILASRLWERAQALRRNLPAVQK